MTSKYPIHWIAPYHPMGFYCGTRQYRWVGSHGNFTEKREEVTCQRCLNKMRKYAGGH